MKDQANGTNSVDPEELCAKPKTTNETKRVRILSKTKMFIKHDGTIIQDNSQKKFKRPKCRLAELIII